MATSDNVRTRNSIEFYLEAYKPYIVETVNARDLLFNYVHFDPKERTDIKSLYQSSPHEATEKALSIIQTSEMSGRFQALLEALEEYPKIVSLLSGKAFVSDEHEKFLITLLSPQIQQLLNPNQLLPHMEALGLLSKQDAQEIQATEARQGAISASYDLLQIVHQRKKDWYRDFLLALIQAGHEHVATIIDEECTAKIIIQMEDGTCGPGRSSSDLKKSGKLEGRGRSSLSSAQYTDSSISNPDSILSSMSEMSLDDTGTKVHVKTTLGGPSDDSHNNLNAAAPSQPRQEEESCISYDPLASLARKLDNCLEASEQSDCPVSSPARRLVEQLESMENNSDLSHIGQRSDPDGTEVPKLSSNNRQEDTSVEVAFSSSRSDPDETSVKDIARGDDIDHTEVKVIYDRQPKMENTGSHDRLIRENSASTDEKTMGEKSMDFPPDESKKEVNLLPNIAKEEADQQDDEEEDVVDEDISLRDYQLELAGPALMGKNVIIVAPTGSGKTRVALKIIQEHMRQMRGRRIPKVIFLVNQVALANQQGEECNDKLRKYKTKIISGESQRSKNERLKDFIGKRDILVVTAQVLLDALVKKEVEDIRQFSLMVFDECHHTHANHTFNQIMHTYMDFKLQDGFDVSTLPQIVGLTASVGVGKATDVDKAVNHIKNLMANLDASQICTVQNHMAELRHYVSMPDEETCTVPRRQNDIFGQGVIRTMETIEKMMTKSKLVKDMKDQVAQFEAILKAPAQKGSAQYTQWVSKLWKEIAKLRSQEVRRFLNPSRTHLEYYNNALIIYNDARVQDALEYLQASMKRWEENAIMDDNEIKLKEIYEMLKKLPLDNCSPNPKLEKLQEMIVKAYSGEKKDSRGIVFVKTRQLAKAIINWMKQSPVLKVLNPTEFVGQTATSEGGMTKNEQHDVLKFFRDGKHKLIVATSVAEEGLDISKCNLVIRYDHVTNEIAMVQSRGRGRAQDSKYIVLAEQGTGMAEKEEINMIREVLMRKAILHLQAHIQRERTRFQGEIKKIQEDAKIDRDIKALTRKGRRIRDGEFELRCLKCDSFICMSSDVKKIQGAHHVVFDLTLKTRVQMIRYHSPRVIDETIQFDGKFICLECGYELGTICIHRSLQFPVIRITSFLVVDMVGRQDTFKRWKDVCFEVSPVTNEDFRALLEQLNTGEGLVE